MFICSEVVFPNGMLSSKSKEYLQAGLGAPIKSSNIEFDHLINFLSAAKIVFLQKELACRSMFSSTFFNVFFLALRFSNCCMLA